MLWTDWERFGSFMDTWRELDRMHRAFAGPAADTAGDFPAVNVWVNGDGALLTAEMAGVNPGDVEISVVGKAVTLRGARNPEELKEGETYHRRERRHGKFSKTIELPFSIETDKVSARSSNGILNITLPRAEAEKPRKISIMSE